MRKTTGDVALRIVEVRIEGLYELDVDDVARSLAVRAGQTPSQSLVQRDVDTLWASGRFITVEPQWAALPNGWQLVYRVKERTASEKSTEWTRLPNGDLASRALFTPNPSPLSTSAADPRPRQWQAVLYSETPVIRGQSEPLASPRKAGEDSALPPPPSRKTVFTPHSIVTPEDLHTEETPQTFSLEEPLADVRIEGNVTIATSDIAKHVKTRPGRVATQQMIRDDVDALVRTRYFATVEPIVSRSGNGPVLTFRVLERPIVRRVEYRGAKKIKVAKLESLTNLKVGSPYDVSANRECARRIEEMYHEKGFAFATVELERGNTKDDREVVFAINEGSKVIVTDVDFQGNKFFSDALLDLKLRTKKRLFWVFGGKYDPATIPDDKAQVEEYYHSLGYFDVKITEDLVFNNDKSRLKIVYNIDEGVRYKIGNVEIMGAEVVPEAELRKDQTVSSGEYYSQRKVAADVEKMREKYGKLGRLFAKVEPQHRHHEDPGVVDLLYKIDEDKVYRVREINVHVAGDHPHTRTNLVRNIATVQPGDLADPKKIQQTKTRLAGSGYFENDPSSAPRLDIRRVEAPWLQPPQVDVARGQDDDSLVGRSQILRGQGDVLMAQGRGPMPGPQGYIFDDSPQGNPLRPAIRDPAPNLWEQMPPPEFIDIDAYLAEARTGRLMFGVGVNSNAGLIGNIVLQENNFDILRPPTSWSDLWNGTAWRGAGQKFRIEAMPGTQVSRYLVDWQDPYFLDTMLNLGVSGFYYQRFFRHWTEQRIGGRIRLGYQLTQQWSTSVAVRLEDVQLSRIPANAPALLKASAGDNFLSTIRWGVAHDTRDSAFMPSTGHYVELSLEQAFNQYGYTRLEAEGRQFFTTYQRPDGFGKHIVTLYGDVAWTGSDTPIYERFYAGGFQSFRGFAFRGVTPLENGIEVGGTFQTLGTVEYMLPVTANEMVKTVVFTDFGTVDTSASLDKFRLAVGAGLRVTVPGMGPVPIALDWTVPVIRQNFDRDQLFSFYIGVNR